MAKYSKKEFAEMCGMVTNALSVYIQRKKITIENDSIDADDPKNAAFLAKWIAKKSKQQPKKLMVTRPPTMKETLPSEPKSRIEDEEEDLPPGAAEYAGLDAKKVAKQIEKMEKEIEKLTLGNSKAKGQVVPIHLMDSIFLQERQSILMEGKNALQDILSIFAKKRDLTPFERADISGEFTDRLNEMMKRAAAATERAIDVIVREFSNKKAVGERN